MSLTLYDKAITEKFKRLILDSEMVVLSPDETRNLFAWKADRANDKPLQLPLIAIDRDREVGITISGNRAMTRSGKVFNSKDGMSDHLNAVPIRINYTLNIYTRKLEEADEYMRSFIFSLINYPKVSISIPYNGSSLKYKSYITVQDSFSDNSDIPERLISGQFSRMTLRFSLNDAYLFSYNNRKVPQVVGIKIVTALGSPEDKKTVIEDEASSIIIEI